MRCAVGIGGGSVVSDALYHWDWRIGCRMGSVVPLRLVGRESCGCRRAVVIGGESVVWVAVRHGD